MTMRKNDKFANQLFSFVMRKTYYLTVNFLCLLSTVDGKLKSILRYSPRTPIPSL